MRKFGFSLLLAVFLSTVAIVPLALPIRDGGGPTCCIT